MSTNKIKTIFIGTPDFGIPALKSLIKNEQFDVKAVISQPDKKVGRKQTLTPPPIKQVALRYNIPIYQPEKISNFQFPISNIDLIVVVAYAQIIPKPILDLPKYGCINVHGSLLPYCRGAACVQQPIIDGKKETGITIMLMNEGLDTGPILSKYSIEIKNNDTAGTIFEKLSILGGKKIIPTLKDYIEGKIKPKEQDEAKSSYVCMLTRADGEIDFRKTAKEVERFIRAMTPWPGTFLKFNNKKIKILKSKHKVIQVKENKPGNFFVINSKLYLQCNNSALEITELQIEGKKPTTGKDFISGYLS